MFFYPWLVEREFVKVNVKSDGTSDDVSDGGWANKIMSFPTCCIILNYLDVH